MFDVFSIRKEFLIFSQGITYLDSAATAQKPKVVIEAIKQFYESDNANVHRGMHLLAERATIAYEDARKTVQKFINAKYVEEIVFTKNCTESINIIAHGLIEPDDHVVLSILEHHSNIVPWLQQKAHVHWIDIDDRGNLNMKELEEILEKYDIKLVAITGQSNVLGICPPLKDIIERAHAAGAKVIVDAAQLIAHRKIDVQDLDCDFLAFSGHKLYGPMGIGVLYGKREFLEQIPPLLGGGMMIREVTRTGFTAADIPQKFEGGTPPVAQAVGLKAAIDWLLQFDWKDIEEHEQNLLEHALITLNNINGLSILCNPLKATPLRPPGYEGQVSCQLKARSGCLSFTLSNIHPHDLTDIIGQMGICLRAGHHCTMPLHNRLGVSASSRISIALYNTVAEIDRLPAAIEHARQTLRGTPTS